MKIYSVCEYGGQWEGSYEYVLGSFISEEKASQFKERLEKEKEVEKIKAEKCDECCDVYYDLYDSEDVVKNTISLLKQSCGFAKFEIIKDKKFYTRCRNKVKIDYDFIGYSISETEINDADDYIITRKGQI